MDREQIEEKLRQILSKRLGKKIAKIDTAVNLKEDLEMDSFSAVEVIYEIEDVFGIEVKEKDFRDAKTFGDVINLIAEKLNL